VNLHSSLRQLLANCKDFKEEETALEHLGSQLGVKVKLTPKFHAEFAGEGVEYSWAHSKAFYRRLPLSAKKGRENFKLMVRRSTCCPINVLTKHRIQKFAGRARAYICTYYHLEQMRRQRNVNLNSEEDRRAPKNQELLFSEIERLMKAFRGHRCALDFDRGFVNAQLKEIVKDERRS